ncbi:hypothetical protein KUTeg_009104 [Tegillarca granosa]|uniref:Ig-like domain-containing protein n=1 Tax=Tegillarca granosa TaxID=220873 RepID=A0ABQ9FCA5_TEGGR|nr:hypothetical protein KUTeg_009104 [Tegillarca granosa]
MDTLGLVMITILFDSTVQFLPPYNPYIITTDMANKLLSCDFPSDVLSTQKVFWYHNGTYIHSFNVYTIVQVNSSVSDGPTVALLNNLSIVEHSNLFVRCSATGNPIPDIIWSRDGVPSFQQNGTALQISNMLRTSNGTYICTATNTLSPSGAASVNKTDSKSIFIDVTYPPDIRFDPPINPFIVYEGQTKVTIRCHGISANPYISSFIWTDSANTTRNNSNELTFYSVSRSAAGDYTCSASNAVGTTLKTVTLKVQYAPIIVGMSNRTVTEWSTLAVTCRAEADPPVSKYWWIHPDGSITNSNQLSIANTNRSQSGTYVCFAENNLTPTGKSFLLKQRSSSLHVDVQYGPDSSVTLTPSKNQYNLTEGDSRPQVTCSAECNPFCSFMWTTPVKTTSSRILIADNISKEESGRYTCHAFNTIQSSVSSFTVTVNYKPSITKTAFLNHYVKENSEAVFQCMIDSQPLSEMTIKFNSSTLFRQSWLNSKDYKIRKSDCLDTGLYFCKAKNFVGETERSTYLYVYCSPRLDSRVQKDNKKLISPNKETNSINTTMHVVAFPKPEMIWLFRDMSGTTISLPLETETINIIPSYQPPLLTVRLIKYNFTDEDHGEYIVTFRNAYGRLVYTIATQDIQIEEQSGTSVGAIVGSIVSLLTIIIVMFVVVIIWRKRLCHKPNISRPKTLPCITCCKDCNCMKSKDKYEYVLH